MKAVATIFLAFGLSFCAAQADGQVDEQTPGREAAQDESAEEPESSSAGTSHGHTHQYPSLGHRQLGEAVKNSHGDRKIWEHALPFMAQDVVDRGFSLPNPYGVSAVVGWLRQNLQLSDLIISIDGGPEQPINFVTFEPTVAQDATVQGKFDFWLLPFMNVFGVMGYIDGKATVPIDIPVDAALNFLGLGGLCPTGPLRPPFCDQNVHAESHPVYHGGSVGIGVLLAGGWKRFFATLPLTYVYSDLNIVRSNISTFTGSVLFGAVLHKAKNEKGRFAVFGGGNYLDAAVDLTGSVILPLSDIDASLQDANIDYLIHSQNSDKWNYVLGFSCEFNPAWQLNFQTGFGGTRDEIIANGVWRF